MKDALELKRSVGITFMLWVLTDIVNLFMGDNTVIVVIANLTLVIMFFLTVVRVDGFLTDIVTYHGDSGGPLTYMMYTPIGTSYHSVMGILTGGDTTISVYSNINNIYSELNLSAY